MRLLVFQHGANEGLGLFERFFRRDGHDVTAYRPDLPGPAPDLADFDGLWVMGGVAQIWEADELGWLRDELDLVRRAVIDLKMPFFGICLGHQMLAHVLGGRVGPAGIPETGVTPVALSEEHAEFHGLARTVTTFQWHSAEVTAPPPGARVTATSDACRVQALAWGDRARSVQFHPEVDRSVLQQWCENPEVPDAFDRRNGAGAMAACLDRLDMLKPDLDHLAESLYRNWMGQTGRS